MRSLLGSVDLSHKSLLKPDWGPARQSKRCVAELHERAITPLDPNVASARRATATSTKDQQALILKQQLAIDTGFGSGMSIDSVLSEQCLRQHLFLGLQVSYFQVRDAHDLRSTCAQWKLRSVDRCRALLAVACELGASMRRRFIKPII
ncbi:MAG: hypothetical protein ACI915_003881 [Gammaproteobacteria bacterium]|jgi:hypothetical protein